MIEKPLEKFIFASRWLLAPFYVGLVFSLVALMVRFIAELAHMLPHFLSMDEKDVLLAVLTLIDLSLAGNLLIIVIFSGYENFVSRLDNENHKDRPAWMGHVDFSGLKIKLLASIIAISGIHLLKSFMNVDSVNKENLMWLVIIHVVFVASGLLLAWMDRLADGGHGSDKGAGAAH